MQGVYWLNVFVNQIGFFLVKLVLLSFQSLHYKLTIGVVVLFSVKISALMKSCMNLTMAQSFYFNQSPPPTMPLNMFTVLDTVCSFFINVWS